ncbi:MAG: site-specific recombinase [Solirubrobacterales bacterium]|nr:site-specific recombinase [Solirubrobacterales bacterium]
MSDAAKQAVIYLRVSSAQQANKSHDSEGFSLPAQREACARQAEALGAAVSEEYMDRGESAKTANRPALRAMLDRLSQGDIDYVIVHKLDRLARNRADDVAIVMRIRQSGACLVSVTENIDETPAGLLLHGIMSSIAEFHSQNLASEVIKGSTQKAKKGGTPYRAPIGYLNIREFVESREIRSVAVDPERGPLITDAFRMYASGDYSLSELGAILEARGLRSRPTPKVPAKPLGVNRLATLLRNSYYVGIVSYQGKPYQGQHVPLTDEATFQEVQDVLEAQRKSGERCWRHHHYLRGSLFCAQCGGRLIYTRAKGNGGLYEYFVCMGRKQGTCSQPNHRAEAVEAAVEDHYDSVQLSERRRESIRNAVRDHVGALAKRASQEIEIANSNLARLENEERKLLAAHYADRISMGLFAEEQERIRRERIAARRLAEQLDFKYAAFVKALDVALSLTDGIQIAYRQAKPKERRLFNQAFFERLEVDNEEISEHKLSDPFVQVLDRRWGASPGKRAPSAEIASIDLVALRNLAAPHEPKHAGTPALLSQRGGSNVRSLVRLRGVEPPRTFRSTRPSTLRVYQFRHRRLRATDTS